MMEWKHIWSMLFSGWDGDIDLTVLAADLQSVPVRTDEPDAAAWVCEQIQGAY